MVSSQEYMASVDDIMNDYLEDGKISVYVETDQEAKQHLKAIRLKQKQLRMVKKDVKHTMKVIRSSYTAKSSEVGKPGLKTGFMSGLIGKKKGSQMRLSHTEYMGVLADFDTVIAYPGR